METDSRGNGEGRLPFATDMDKLAFLLESDAELWLGNAPLARQDSCQ